VGTGIISKFSSDFAAENSGVILLRALSFMLLSNEAKLENYFVMDIEKD
jgi:hypothetical protein